MLGRDFGCEVASCEHRKCQTGLFAGKRALVNAGILAGKWPLVNAGNVRQGFWLESGLL